VRYALALLVACGGSHKAPDAAEQIDAPDVLPVAITVTLTDRPNTPATFSFIAAYQDGTGAWQAAPTPTGDTYTFGVTSGMWSFAWTCVTPIEREVQMYRFTVAERTALTDQIFLPGCTDRNPTPIPLSGTITSPPAAGTIEVAWGGSNVAATTSSSGMAYTFDPGVPPGTHDLLATHRAPVGGSSFTVDSAVLQTGVAVTASTTQAIAFASSHATQTAAITNVPANALVFSGMTTAGGTSEELSFYTAPPAAGGYLAIGLNASQAQPGDVYVQLIGAIVSGESLNTETYDAAATAHSWLAPPLLGNATSTVATTTPYPQIRTTWPAYTSTFGYTWSASENLTPAACGGMGCTVSWDAYVSPGVGGASPQFELPDLSAVAGWDPRLALQTGTMATILVGAGTSSAGPSDFPPALVPAVGTVRTHASSGSQLPL
jgi:hypothetical protein